MAEQTIDLVWREGVELLGRGKRSVIGRMLKLCGGDAEAVLETIRMARFRIARGLLQGDPVAWMICEFHTRRRPTAAERLVEIGKRIDKEARS